MMPIDPVAKIDITLDAQEWSIVLDIICKSTGFPYITTAPLEARMPA